MSCESTFLFSKKMFYRINHIWMGFLPRKRLAIWTYRMWHEMSFQQVAILERFCATKKITFKCILLLLFAYLICLILRYHLVWGLLIRLNGLYIILRLNLLLRYMLHLVISLCLWLLIPILPKIFPILTKILLCLEQIDHLLGDLLLLRFQLWVHHLHSSLLICLW